MDTSPLETLDSYLTQICASMPVDLMPGSNDPATASMPQQPMHFSMFARSCMYSSLNSVTNPHLFECDGVR